MLHYYHYACAGHAVDQVQGSMPFKYVASTLGYTQWTWSRAFADLVQPLFGRGAISPLGPGPTTMPHRYLRATLGGPGPPHKITPRPNIGHTKAKTQSHLSQIPPGPGPRPSWTRSTTHKIIILFNNHIIKQLIEYAYEKNRSSHTPLRRTSQCPALSHKHEGA